MATRPSQHERLTIAVTGPTGEIGRATVRALERSAKVGRIIGMARRPFDPADHGWRRTEYRRGDILDRAAVAALVEDVDVVVHLAFVIFGGSEETRRVNLEGSRNVFEAAISAGARRLVYTSSVAAYGFHEDNPEVVSESIEPLGTNGFYYSAQKAELESLLADITQGSTTDVYVFRPCIVAGPDAPMLIESLTGGRSLGGAVRRIGRALGTLPLVKPVLPDSGVPFQLVHHDDVATAIRSAAVGAGPPGVYNLAGDGRLTVSDLARELGWRSIPLPRAAVDLAAEVIPRVPLLPPRLSWVVAFRRPVLMDCARARKRLGWQPKRDVLETLRATIDAARAKDLL